MHFMADVVLGCSTFHLHHSGCLYQRTDGYAHRSSWEKVGSKENEDRDDHRRFIRFHPGGNGAYPVICI